ncbi:MAG: prepilin-type N-terminal cleavage/methylation domain-containing protein [Candidatus Omnitrophica bacterium]|nr:prepilin-type N-terminal cleavage/methylation domain-containing protein [Candidatus Omnitrophota bacterium]
MPNRKNAFTLIELVMVIVIIAVLVAVVSFSSGTLKLTGVANKLMFDLRYAQQLAISRQVSCGTSFNPAGNSYFVYVGDTGTLATNPHTGSNLSIDYDIDSDYSGISLVSTNFGDQVSFDAAGAPYGSTGALLATRGIITLQSGSDTKTVTIEANTGEVKVP